jgi:hypothetical protein
MQDLTVGRVVFVVTYWVFFYKCIGVGFGKSLEALL